MNRLAWMLSVMTLTACGSDPSPAPGGNEPASAPEAPSGVNLEVMADGIHVTWIDTSNDEDGFFVERSADGGVFEIVASPDADSEEHHDAPLATGVSYTYRVGAANAAGESWSDEASLEMP